MENQLVKIAQGQIGGATVQTVNARDLHAFLGVGKDFSNWIKGRIEGFGFVENSDYMQVIDSIDRQNGRTINSKAYDGAKTPIEYALTLDMAKELSMVERNEKGKQARQYFIECERRAKAGPMLDVRNPATLTAIAMQLIEVNKELTARAEAAEQKVEAAKPKVTFFDRFANADGLYGLQNAARVLGKNPNKFIQTLKQGYLFYQGGVLVPKVQYREMGIFEVKSVLVDDKARYQTFVTPKGIQYFARKLGATPLFPDPE